MRAEAVTNLLGVPSGRYFTHIRREQAQRIKALLRQLAINSANASRSRSPKTFPVNRAYGHADRLEKSHS